MEQINFRKAIKEDSEHINKLVNSVYRGESSKKGWTTEADLLGGQRIDSERIKEIISTPANYILLAVYDNALIGCVHLEKKPASCYLGMLSVDGNLQRSGIGKLLIQYAEDFAKKELKSPLMEMTVIGQRTELIDYYKRRGYRVTGEKRNFPAADPRFGIPKRNDLYFEVLVKNL